MSLFRHAVILAAGRGMRMMPLTAVIPKPMAPFDGTTLIASGIEKLRESIPNVHITVGYKGAVLAQHVIEHGVTTVFNTEGHGNAWWLFNTLLGALDEPLLVLTCDNVIDLDLDRLWDDYHDLQSPLAMLVPVRPVEGMDGDYIRHVNQKITHLSRTERTDIYGSGIQVLFPSRLRKTVQEVEDFSDVWAQLMVNSELYCSRVYPQRWAAIDTLEQLNLFQCLQEDA